MSRKIHPSDFRVAPGKKFSLSRRPAQVGDFYQSREDYEHRLGRFRRELGELQSALYAEQRHGVLILIQGMDTSGKDGIIKHVMSGVNPQSCRVTSFKKPSQEELGHDFLWRCHRAMPERGTIGIFNRSYYEEVLVVRVHPELLRAERLPERVVGRRGEIWRDRFRDMVNFEHFLARNGYCILKFFLHLSKKEQRKRLEARLYDPMKNWKAEIGDLEERKFWRQYQRAYQDCFAKTSTPFAPWYVVPADDKKNARLIVGKIIVQAVRSLRVGRPPSPPGRRAEIEKMKRMLARER